MRQEGEPSVEQILRSIKKVMARDAERAFTGRAGGDTATQPLSEPETQPELPPTPEPSPDPVTEDEATELRDVADDGAAPALFAEPRLDEAESADPAAPEPDADDLIEDEADGEADLEADPGSVLPAREAAGDEPAALEVASNSHPTAAPTRSGEALTSAATMAATRRSLAALAMLTDPAAPLPTGPAGDAALRGIVRELLQPMLAGWLEANLPAIVEREVRAEIARISGGVG